MAMPREYLEMAGLKHPLEKASGSLWSTAELPKIRRIVRPIYQRMGMLTEPGIT
jgi:hypothetical protein